MILHLYIEATVADTPVARAMAAKIQAPAVVVDGLEEVYALIGQAEDPVSAGKNVLVVSANRGAFIRPCPGTRHYTCCDYTILHIGTYCVLDCAYCILQAYFHPPILQFFANHAQMLTELDMVFQAQGPRRIGTGEFTDSLIWQRWYDLNAVLVPRFAAQTHAVLELKTKTTAIESLEKLDHNKKTIMAWSLNTEKVIAEQERRTASLKARLKAAAQTAAWGYPLAFHFDPLVLYPGCEADYRKVVEMLFAAVPGDRVVWISLGALRFMPALKPIVARRFASSKIIYGEFVPGLDGKMRYFKPLRIALFRQMAAWIRQAAPETVIYLCMEDDEVWEKSLGFAPGTKGRLPRMLDGRAAACCDLEQG